MLKILVIIYLLSNFDKTISQCPGSGWYLSPPGTHCYYINSKKMKNFKQHKYILKFCFI